uniref:Paired domain-containing protein n=1 Tax=Rhodnius prolixus TaxID=13249 RepID=T1I5V6_RHOPR
MAHKVTRHPTYESTWIVNYVEVKRFLGLKLRFDFFQAESIANSQKMVITAEQVVRIIALVEDGLSQRYAARTLGLPETTVRRAIHRYRETGLCTRRQGSGRPRATEALDDRFIRIHTLRNRTSTPSDEKLLKHCLLFVEFHSVPKPYEEGSLK